MIVFSHLYYKMKREREEYYRHQGRLEGREERRAEALAKREEEVAALKAQVAEREKQVAALKAQVAQRYEMDALRCHIADGVAEGITRGMAERDQEIAALKAQVAELQRRRNGNADGNQSDDAPNL